MKKLTDLLGRLFRKPSPTPDNKFPYLFIAINKDGSTHVIVNVDEHNFKEFIDYVTSVFNTREGIQTLAAIAKAIEKENPKVFSMMQEYVKEKLQSGQVQEQPKHEPQEIPAMAYDVTNGFPGGMGMLRG